MSWASARGGSDLKGFPDGAAAGSGAGAGRLAFEAKNVSALRFFRGLGVRGTGGVSFLIAACPNSKPNWRFFSNQLERFVCSFTSVTDAGSSGRNGLPHSLRKEPVRV